MGQSIDENGLISRMTAFSEAFVRELPKKKGDALDIICVDGKVMRGTLQSNGRNPDIVSAYSPRAGITLATEACDEKSNEIKEVPRLIERLDLIGKVVTADAMAMQKGIIDAIRRRGGDFIIELKGNQSTLRYGIEDKIKSAFLSRRLP
ncbi:ISAs1 family transposase [uncultured Parabacteroides sp.]|uniref:ISAs1 family transposase n=1 Tax=uncultured Parabacteroides sp. TaxID=512312 RepID=UPI003421C943